MKWFVDWLRRFPRAGEGYIRRGALSPEQIARRSIWPGVKACLAMLGLAVLLVAGACRLLCH
jgi:hypothetical protein